MSTWPKSTIPITNLRSASALEPVNGLIVVEPSGCLSRLSGIQKIVKIATNMSEQNKRNLFESIHKWNNIAPVSIMCIVRIYSSDIFPSQRFSSKINGLIFTSSIYDNAQLSADLTVYKYKVAILKNFMNRNLIYKGVVDSLSNFYIR